MALTIHATVKSASKGSATLEAKAGQVVVPDGWQRDADAINATTEGTIKAATLELTFDGDCPLAKGQVVTIEADFAAADEGDGPAEAPATPAPAEPDPSPRPRPATKKAAAKKATKSAPAKKAAAKKASTSK